MQPEEPPNAESKAARWQRLFAVALGGLAVACLLVRAVHAGALWRDEAAVVRLATLPSLGELLELFPHEAFPPPFPLFVRAFAALCGSGDAALRAFGATVGLAILGALWVNARATARALPV